MQLFCAKILNRQGDFELKTNIFNMITNRQEHSCRSALLAV